MQRKASLDQLINKARQNEDLDQDQLLFLEKYINDEHFRYLLSLEPYHRYPFVIDYFRLVEKEISASNSLTEFWKRKVLEIKENSRRAEELKSSLLAKDEGDLTMRRNNGQPFTTPDNLKQIWSDCHEIARNDADARKIFLDFFATALKGHQQLEQAELPINTYIDNWPDNWYTAPWYCLYVQYFGTDDTGKGSFDSLLGMLDYLEKIGIKNLCILPHYESMDGDEGYDITEYQPGESLGGEKAFLRFMKQALDRGFRVVTDLVFSYVSTRHEWFVKALEGNSHYFNYFIKCPWHWQDLDLDAILDDRGDDPFLNLPDRDENGKSTNSRRLLFFPELGRKLWLERHMEELNKTVLFYNELYPFQVSLDVRTPEVIHELFELLATEFSFGMAGKRLSGIAHWIKEPGTTAIDLPETHALIRLIKQFVKHINPRAALLPDVVTSSKELKKFGGRLTHIAHQMTTTEGDGLMDFQLQGMLREMIYFQKTAPFWNQVYDRGEEIDSTAFPLLPIEHHNETYLGFIQEKEAMSKYIDEEYRYQDKNNNWLTAKRGIVYREGKSAGARMADCLNRDPHRIAMSIFTLYMMPAAPVMYYGTEIGATNDLLHFKVRKHKRFEVLSDQQTSGPENYDIEQCEDPRALQRGPITAWTFHEALSERYPAVQVLSALNKLREEKAALHSYYFANVDTFNSSLLGMIRYPAYPNDTQRPILVLVNLSEAYLEAKIPANQLRQRLARYHFTFHKLLQLRSSDKEEVIFYDNEIIELPADYLYIQLEPFGAELLEIV